MQPADNMKKLLYLTNIYLFTYTCNYSALEALCYAHRVVNTTYLNSVFEIIQQTNLLNSYKQPFSTYMHKSPMSTLWLLLFTVGSKSTHKTSAVRRWRPLLLVLAA